MEKLLLFAVKLLSLAFFRDSAKEISWIYETIYNNDMSFETYRSNATSLSTKAAEICYSDLWDGFRQNEAGWWMWICGKRLEQGWVSLLLLPILLGSSGSGHSLSNKATFNSLKIKIILKLEYILSLGHRGNEINTDYRKVTTLHLAAL